MTKTAMSITAIIIAAVLFLAVNVASNEFFKSARVDLTADRLYTLSEGTKNVLENLDEPITLRFFYSSKLAATVPQWTAYGNRVRDLLAEYVDLSGGKIRLEVIDPEPFSDAEDRAVGFGLQGVPVTAGGDLFYFGLAGTNSTDDRQVIPFFSQEKEQFLEYDLTKFVYSLTNSEKPVVGILSELPLEYGPGGLQAAMRGQAQPYAIMEPLRQFFTVKILKQGFDDIDEEIDILLLVHPRDLSDKTLYAVDQFVLRGGRAMVYVDAFSETAAQMPPPPGQQPDPGDPHASDLGKLFTAWGVKTEAEKLVGDRFYATPVNAGGQSRRQVVNYISWLGLRDDAFNREDVITSELDFLTLASSGHLSATDDATTTLTPLLASSADSVLFDVARVRQRPDPEALLTDFEPDEQSYILAARLSGPVKSAFEARPAPEQANAESADAAEGEEKPDLLPHLAEAETPINVIIVADADTLDDRFWIRKQSLLGQELVLRAAANGDFLINGLDNLAGSDDLISLRSRARSARPFVLVEDIQRAAEQRFLSKEKTLQEKLQTTQEQIAELQSKAQSGNSALLSEEEAQAIENFRGELVQTRKELRTVQHDLRKDIENLEMRIKFVNIGLVPLVIFIVALGVAWVRYSRRKASIRSNNPG